VFNPFGLNGPEFLIFYTLLGILVNLILRIISHKYRREVIDIDLWSSSDPYTIAYLRAGFQESLRVVVFSLMKRGLLRAAGDLVESRDSTKKMKLLPLEKAVLDYFVTPHNVFEVYSDTALITLGDEYQKDLEEKNLLFNQALPNHCINSQENRLKSPASVHRDNATTRISRWGLRSRSVSRCPGAWSDGRRAESACDAHYPIVRNTTAVPASRWYCEIFHDTASAFPG